jgi:hypothetical protein
MFDLEAAILDWRSQMRREGIGSPAVLDELEGHLRADIDEQIQKGVMAQSAFEAGVRRLGKSDLLQREFSKLDSDRPAPIATIQAKMIFAGAAGLIISVTAWMLVRSQMLPGLRLSAEAQAFSLAGFAVFEFLLLAWLWKIATRSSEWAGTGSFSLEGFSMPARQSFEAAREEARSFRHDFVGTEHLLLGLLKEPDGIAANILGRMGLTSDQIRKEILDLVGSGVSGNLRRDFPLTPRARRALSLAAKEARTLQSGNKIGPEHVLLGLLLEGHGIAGLVLRKLKVEASAARQEILKAIGSPDKQIGVEGK